MNRPMLTERDIKIRAYEIDAVGIVSNIVYIKWFEDLRHAFLDAYYPFDIMVSDGISPVLMKTEAKYLSPLRIEDKPIGRCWAAKMAGVRWEIAIEISCGDKVYCKGLQKGCFINIATGMPTRVPEQLVEACEADTKTP